jgi:glycosyltransferase involved in cell wall biosynthesis
VGKIRILIHPDIFYTGHSGAIAAREAARQLTVLGYEIAVFTHDKQNLEIANYRNYQRIPYNGLANYVRSKYEESFKIVIDDFKPNYMFFIGGIVNTPVVYLDLCIKFEIKTAFLLLVQDFYCVRLHAALGTNSCTLCLEKSNMYAFKNNCAEKQSRPLLTLINYQIIQKMFLKRLKKVDFVLGSTFEQLDFYLKIGLNKENLVKIPLFFDQTRVKQMIQESKPYFVIIGQYRHEKGMHLISSILDYVEDGITIKTIFYNQSEADQFLATYPENIKYLKSGKLEVLPGITMTNGAVELIASSKGVINTTIWATTTEFVLLETLGLSKPILTFDVGIHKEVIKNRINGICVKAGDFKAMGNEINNLNNDPILEKRISEGANKLYHHLTDQENFLPILKTIFI